MQQYYKLKAVLTRKGQYVPAIRCGFTGRHLLELTPEPTVKDAIAMCKERLAQLIAASAFSD